MDKSKMDKLEKFAQRLDAPTRMRLEAMFKAALAETDPVSRAVAGENLVTEIRKAMKGSGLKN